MNNLAIALDITLLGMGLVFAAIILLWGMIKLLTTLTADKGDSSGREPAPSDSPEVTTTLNEDIKARAAAVAVAIALAKQQASSAHPLSAPSTAIVSAWQLGMRTRQMYQKGLPVRRQHS
ncbi:MAG TPA: OadG family protein [Anaerolineales bacterium]